MLLIEDSGDAREMLRMMLELAGHVVYDAADGVRGLELLNVGAVRTWGSSTSVFPGWTVIRSPGGFARSRIGQGMLLLAMTGEGPSDAERCSFEQGFDHHLVKPIDPDRLIGLLSDMAEVLH